MDITITPLSDVQQEADIKVTSNELRPHFEEAYERFRPKAEFRGFRKGKVPMDLVRKLYGEAIEHDALDTIAEALYRQAMEQKNIRPIGQPALVDMDFKRGDYLRFKIKYEIRPDVTLKKYTGLTFEKPVHTVTDAEVDAEVLHIRRSNSTPERVEKVLDADTIVTADVQEIDASGTPIIGKKTTSARFHLYDETLAPEIRSALSTAETGQTYRVSIERQEEEKTPPIHLAISVTSIDRVTPPQLDDELVKKVTGGKTDTTNAFLTNLRSDLQRYWNDQADSRLGNAIADELVRQHEFAVPESLVDAFLDSFVEDLKSHSRNRSLPADFNEKQFRADQRTNAIWQAKWMLLKEKIAEVENIGVADEDLAHAAEVDAARVGIEQEKLRTYYATSSAVKDRILSDKIMAFLKEHATIKETVAGEAPSRLTRV